MLQVRIRSAHHKHCAVHGNGKILSPGFGTLFRQHTRGNGDCVVHQNVELSVALYSIAYQPVDGMLIADIHGKGFGGTTREGDFGNHLLKRFQSASADDDPGSLGGKSFRNSCSDTGTPASDYGNFVFESVSHGFLR
jgi:hypothetical protein